jgi:hypothetical protein
MQQCDARAVDALYVYEGGTLAEGALAIGDAVGLPLELHDSSYYGATTTASTAT